MLECRDSRNSSSHRLVVVHQGALGDFLLMLPVLEGLYLLYPNLRIDFWSKREHFGLIADKPFAGSFHSCDGSELLPFFHDNPAKEAQVPRFFLNAHTVLIFGQKSSLALAAALGQRLTCPVHWIQSFPVPDANPFEAKLPVHTCDFLKEQLRHLGWYIEETVASIEAEKNERSLVREWLAQRGIAEESKPLLVHPGSGGRKKIWPLSRWWNLLRWINEKRPHPVLMTLGPADGYLKEFAEKARSLGVYPVEEITLPRLAAFLAESSLYVGSDSGVSHLAAAVGLPTVVIFGPTDPKVWAPRGREVYVIQSRWEESEVPPRPALDVNSELSLELQIEAVMKKLTCAPLPI